MSPFLAIFSGNRDTTKARINKLREIFKKCIYSWDKNIPVSVSVEFENFRFEYGQDCFEDGGVISKNDLESQKSHNVQEVQM